MASAPRTDAVPQIMHADDDDGGIIDNDGGDPKQLSWWVNRVTEITQTLGRDLEEFPENPSQAISQIMNDIPLLVADEVGHAVEAYQAFARLCPWCPAPESLMGRSSVWGEQQVCNVNENHIQ